MVNRHISFCRRRWAAFVGALLAGFLIATAVVSVSRPDSNTVDTAALEGFTARQIGEASPSRSLGSPISDGKTKTASAPRAIDDQPDLRPSDAVADSTGEESAPVADSSTTIGPSTTSAAPATATASTKTPESNLVASTAPPTTSGKTTSGETTQTPNSSSAPASTTGPKATPAPTTTAPKSMPMPQQGVGSAFTTKKFTEWPIRNTNMDGRQQFVSTPASQLGLNNFVEGSDRAIALGAVAANKSLGQFRTQCSFSHFNYDDALVHPGKPGAAHLHMYFGNTQANASSTYRSLLDSGSSTCNGFEGNRSAYWIPAVFDASGSVRIPSRIELYYKSHDGSQSIVKKPPEGLGMVAGQAATNPYVEWGCQETGAQGTNLNRPVQQLQNTIPACSKTATLLAHIKFPQCLSGTITPTSGNATSQMQYPNGGYYSKNCPGGSQYITSIEFFIAWNPDNHDGNTSNWWLSSDVRPDGTRAPNGSTLHGDWFGGWNPQLMDKIHANCIARLAECSWDLVDSNQRLKWIEHYGAKNSASYTGPRAIPASEISQKLCPGDSFSRPEDAAMCGGH